MALTVATPREIVEVDHAGSGTLVLIRPGHTRWFTIPVATPAIIGDAQVVLQKLFVMFPCHQGAVILDVAVFDGEFMVQEFGGLHLSCTHGDILESEDTFNLAASTLTGRLHASRAGRSTTAWRRCCSARTRMIPAPCSSAATELSR